MAHEMQAAQMGVQPLHQGGGAMDMQQVLYMQNMQAAANGMYADPGQQMLETMWAQAMSMAEIQAQAILAEGGQVTDIDLQNS